MCHEGGGSAGQCAFNGGRDAVPPRARHRQKACAWHSRFVAHLRQSSVCLWLHQVVCTFRPGLLSVSINGLLEDELLELLAPEGQVGVWHTAG